MSSVETLEPVLDPTAPQLQPGASGQPVSADAGRLFEEFFQFASELERSLYTSGTSRTTCEPCGAKRSACCTCTCMTCVGMCMHTQGQRALIVTATCNLYCMQERFRRTQSSRRPKTTAAAAAKAASCSASLERSRRPHKVRREGSWPNNLRSEGISAQHPYLLKTLQQQLLHVDGSLLMSCAQHVHSLGCTKTAGKVFP